MTPNANASVQEAEPIHFGPGAEKQDEYVSFKQVRRELPSLRDGKPVHPGTLHRWRLQGLQTARVGGTVCTTRRWLREFFESRSGNPGPPPALPRSPAKRQRDLARVDRELAALGL